MSFHMEDLAARGATYDELAELPVGDLYQEADRYGVDDLCFELDDIVQSNWTRIDAMVAKLADRIDSQRRDADLEPRAEIAAMWLEAA